MQLCATFLLYSAHISFLRKSSFTVYSSNDVYYLMIRLWFVRKYSKDLLTYSLHSASTCLDWIVKSEVRRDGLVGISGSDRVHHYRGRGVVHVAEALVVGLERCRLGLGLQRTVYAAEYKILFSDDEIAEVVAGFPSSLSSILLFTIFAIMQRWGLLCRQEQEAQLMLTTGSTRLAVSRGQQTWYHSTCYI